MSEAAAMQDRMSPCDLAAGRHVCGIGIHDGFRGGCLPVITVSTNAVN